MNKTVKTIAWICLVLGLLGLAVDIGVYVRGRSLVAKMQERMESGEIPAFKDCLTDGGDDCDIDAEHMEAWRSDRDGKLGFGGKFGSSGSFGSFSDRGGFTGSMRDGRFSYGLFGGFALPLFLLAAGPVLTVVGVVMLIVNREPKTSDAKKKAQKSKNN